MTFIPYDLSQVNIHVTMPFLMMFLTSLPYDSIMGTGDNRVNSLYFFYYLK